MGETDTRQPSLRPEVIGAVIEVAYSGPKRDTDSGTNWTIFVKGCQVPARSGRAVCTRECLMGRCLTSLNVAGSCWTLRPTVHGGTDVD